MIHVLDTSAVLAHFLDEPGAEQVESLLGGGAEHVALAAPVWTELERRLAELTGDERETDRVFRHYTRDLCGLIVLDEVAALAGIRIRRACRGRLPLVDALIAGCAAAHRATLVHRDPHFDRIPVEHLATLRLPDKLAGD